MASAVGELEPVDLDQLDRAQLHDRVESKVILNTSDVPAVLGGLAHEYFVLEHVGERLQGYVTEYFDSASLRNYHEHHNQLRRRLKLRYRTYENSNMTYFELKRNVNGRTVKERRRSRLPLGQLWDEDARYFAEQTGLDSLDLTPSLTVAYRRILLVRRDFSERVTIDLGLRFSSRNGSTGTAPELSICEFKQPRLDRCSPAMIALNRQPQMFSKYCMGLAACDPSLRRNRFKKVFLNLDGLSAAPTVTLVAP